MLPGENGASGNDRASRDEGVSGRRLENIQRNRS
jgi:hypothetical protein